MLEKEIENMIMKKVGRPKGSTKENNKKMYSFRLSEDELKAVREVLAKMRNKLIILFCLLTFALPCKALTLEAGVEYTQETAKIEAFDGIQKYLTFANQDEFKRSLFIASINYDDVSYVVEYKAKYKGLPYKFYGVIYKDEPTKIYTYIKKSNGYKGLAVVVYSLKNNVIKSANYDAQTGKIVCVGLIAGEEEYKYDAESGKLLGYWRNNKLKSADNKVSAVLNVLYGSP